MKRFYDVQTEIKRPLKLTDQRPFDASITMNERRFAYHLQWLNMLDHRTHSQ